MASSSAQKLKVLHLMDILRTETDPDHGLTMPQLIERLAAKGIDAERKGLYRDIERWYASHAANHGDSHLLVKCTRVD